MPARDLGQLYMAAKHLQQLQELLRIHVPRAHAWAYGSRVSGGAHEGSDLDVVLRYSDINQEPDGWADLKEALQASSIPFMVEVYVWSRLSEDFHQNILTDYVVLQGNGAV